MVLQKTSTKPDTMFGRGTDFSSLVGGTNASPPVDRHALQVCRHVNNLKCTGVETLYVKCYIQYVSAICHQFERVDFAPADSFTAFLSVVDGRPPCFFLSNLNFSPYMELLVYIPDMQNSFCVYSPSSNTDWLVSIMGETHALHCETCCKVLCAWLISLWWAKHWKLCVCLTSHWVGLHHSHTIWALGLGCT